MNDNDDLYPEAPDPADDAYGDWLDAHEHDDFDFGADFRSEIDAEIDRQHVAWSHFWAACAELDAIGL